MENNENSNPENSKPIVVAMGFVRGKELGEIIQDTGSAKFDYSNENIFPYEIPAIDASVVKPAQLTEQVLEKIDENLKNRATDYAKRVKEQKAKEKRASMEQQNNPNTEQGR